METAYYLEADLVGMPICEGSASESSAGHANRSSENAAYVKLNALVAEGPIDGRRGAAQ